MKSILIKIVGLALLVLLPACSSTGRQNRQVMSAFQPGVPGGKFVETFQTTLTVVAVDTSSRRIAFRAEDGGVNTFLADPQVQNLESYRPGDTVKMSVVRELAMFLDNNPPPTSSTVAEAVAKMPDVRPGVFLAGTEEMRARVLSVDSQDQTAVLMLGSGRAVTFKVRPDVDLLTVKVGTTGSIRMSTAMAMLK